jgi:UDP-N-acetylmuramoyl-L-alanyl-D-glutamate--2,6-diaminopimelate ligase
VEFHGSWEAYFEAKARLFTEVAGGRPAVLNRDDQHFARLSERVLGPIMTYGLDAAADLFADDVRPGDDRSTCELRAGEERARCTVPLPGRFNVYNALAATGLALVDRLSLQAAADGLSGAKPPPGRLERVDEGQAFKVLVDYAHTMHGFRSVLSELRDRTPPPHRLIAVFGATGDRDRAKRPMLARIAREFSDFFIITNEDPYGEQVEAIMAEVASGAPRAEEGVRYECERDRARAIEKAILRAGDGDTVVILGKGHEQNMVVAGQKRSWSDVAVARRALERMH